MIISYLKNLFKFKNNLRNKEIIKTKDAPPPEFKENNEYPDYTNCNQILNYDELLENALRFSSELHNKCNIEFNETKQAIDFHKNQELPKILLRTLKRTGQEYPLELNCHYWSHKLLNDIISLFNMKAYVTYGQVWICHDNRKECLYPVTWEQLKKAKNLIVPENPIIEGLKNFHAWITLESGQIIDLTLFSTLAKQDENFKDYYAAINYTENNENSIKYVPMYFFHSAI